MWQVPAGLIVGIIITFILIHFKNRYKTNQVEVEIQKKQKDLDDDLKKKRDSFEIELKDYKYKCRKELEKNFKKDSRMKWLEIRRTEKKLEQREQQVNKQTNQMETKEKVLEKSIQKAAQKEKSLDELCNSETKKLEEIAAMSHQEAKDEILKQAENDLTYELALKIKHYEDEFHLKSEAKAIDIITTSIERCNLDQIVDSTVSTVSLPDDEMKGRIIGREGRNIRAFETVTGVSLIIDDTPEAVVLSSFDPIRRELAKMTLDKLVRDGRIHPARIESVYKKCEKELAKKVQETGERTILELGIRTMKPEIVSMLGKLQYRTSYGQNVLQHSIEVAHLSAMMATELGLKPELAKRAGLLHDIGKILSHEVEGGHAQIGADVLRKRGESPKIVHAVMAHHEDIKAETVEAVLVKVADAISAARTGARRETLEIYIKRLRELEDIALKFEGVDRVFAIQAGRELRVMVKPEVIDDVKTQKLAHDVAKAIQDNLEYPGQVKVLVIREIREVEYAR